MRAAFGDQPAWPAFQVHREVLLTSTSLCTLHSVSWINPATFNSLQGISAYGLAVLFSKRANWYVS